MALLPQRHFFSTFFTQYNPIGCLRKFREKFSLLAHFDADIIVIQECEDPQSASSDSYSAFASNVLWIGHNKNKGLGVLRNQDSK